MIESRPQDIPNLKTCPEIYHAALGRELKAKYDQLMSELQVEHPELFLDDRRMTREQRVTIQDEFIRLWHQKVGIGRPQVASLLDHSQEATCLKCHDGGWVQPIKTDADGNRIYLDPIPCPTCNPFDEEKKRRRLAYAGIPDTQAVATFESFKHVKGSEEAFKAAKELVFGAPFYMLLIYGPYGNGKTHLAYAAVREAARQGMQARFVYLPDMLAEIRLRIDRNDNSQAYIDEIKGTQFLALDEIGFEHNTPWQASLLEEIINHRYANYLHTILTTNRDIKALPGPLLSRFRDGQVARMVLNEAKDFRPNKKATRGQG